MNSMCAACQTKTQWPRAEAYLFISDIAGRRSDKVLLLVSLSSAGGGVEENDSMICMFHNYYTVFGFSRFLLIVIF